MACLKVAAGLMVSALPITVMFYLALSFFIFLSIVCWCYVIDVILSNVDFPGMVNQQAISWCS